MATVGAFEAKTHLPQLLERVARGEKITITKRGKPIAMLVPAPLKKSDVRKAVKRMQQFRERMGPKLKGLSIAELVSEGRRF
jgi:prevent-host-death family protein